MSILLSQSDRRTQLGALILDCLLTEEIDFESQVTIYPVEDGTEISDHITQGSKRVRISGVMSTADVSGGFGFSSLFGYASDSSVKLVDVVEAIERMHTARQLVEISTGQIVYPDMAFTNLSISRSADGGGGNWASIKAELIRIRKVKLKTADVPAAETVAAPADGRAGQTNKPAGKSTAAGGGSGSSSSAQTAPAQRESLLSQAKTKLLPNIQKIMGGTP